MFQKTAQPKITRGKTLNHVAWIYDLLSPPMMFYHENRIARKVIELLNIKGHEKILDIGCGTGSLTIQIGKKLSSQKGGLIIGLDAAQKMIARAQKKAVGLEQVRFDFAAAENLPYPDDYFDCAVSTFFFHHVDLDLKKKTLLELWRVLKKGGKVVIADVDIPRNFFGKFCAWSGYFLFRQGEIKENIEGKLRELINSSPFKTFKITASYLGYISVFEIVKGV